MRFRKLVVVRVAFDGAVCATVTTAFFGVLDDSLYEDYKKDTSL
jgi:hypothetical protein